MRVLGIDPGLGRCGFGMISTTTGADAKLMDYGVITTIVDAPIPSRLKELYESLILLFKETKPDVVSVEKLFFSKTLT